ncbi:hypothetical protein FRC12_006578 [Ceratobasidium sp. 428]|nr:hypothetical protein FRC12_006578 [Ceratobasidium sp. 428]
MLLGTDLEPDEAACPSLVDAKFSPETHLALNVSSPYPKSFQQSSSSTFLADYPWIPTYLDDYLVEHSEWDINLASLGQSLTGSRMGWEHILGPTLEEDSDVDWDGTRTLGPSTPREDELEHGTITSGDLNKATR